MGGYTPLHEVVGEINIFGNFIPGDITIVRLLVSKGAGVDIKSSPLSGEAMTPLELAKKVDSLSGGKNKEIVEYLSSLK